MENYIDAADVAKIVRQELLKNLWQATKFSVHTKKYAGGASICVNWTDGPTTDQVKEKVGSYHGATFDGMQDLMNYHENMLNGKRCHFMNDFIFFSRQYSKELLEDAARKMEEKYHLERPAIKMDSWSKCYQVEDNGKSLGGGYNYYWSTEQIVYRIAEGQD